MAMGDKTHTRSPLSRLFLRLKKRKRTIIIVLAWALGISLIYIKAHWLFYLETPKFWVYKIPFGNKGPQFSVIDLLILGIISIIAGVLLAKAEHIVYGYLMSIGLSFTFSFGYVVFFIWSVLGWGDLLFLIPSGWEWAFLWAILNVLFMMFPAAVMICLFGAIVGGILRSWLKP